VSSMRETVAVPADASQWRPMAFGDQSPRRIRDAVCEPLWGGDRVLIEVGAGGVVIRDVDGDWLDGHVALREAIVRSALANELLLDGYLLPAPLRDTEGAEATPGADAMPTAAQMGRQLIFGSGTNRRREELEREAERHVDLPPEAPAAFVAVDLLWLDGEPLLDVPLLERKRLLDSALADHEVVRRTMIVRPPVEAWYAQWRALGFREIAVKSANSRYRPGTVSVDWTTAAIPRR
jgi:ATP dependent DNA ligase-like protein